MEKQPEENKSEELEKLTVMEMAELQELGERYFYGEATLHATLTDALKSTYNEEALRQFLARLLNVEI